MGGTKYFANDDDDMMMMIIITVKCDDHDRDDRMMTITRSG